MRPSHSGRAPHFDALFSESRANYRVFYVVAENFFTLKNRGSAIFHLNPLSCDEMLETASFSTLQIYPVLSCGCIESGNNKTRPV
jgi:hypothetical protein